MNLLHPLDLLRQARIRYSQGELASLLGVDVRTIRRWEVRENDPPPYLADAIRQRILPLVNAKATHHYPFTFIDLFAGIGGIRLGFEKQGGHCVFTSEWNAFAQKTYLANFSHDADHVFIGDITKVNEEDIPDHDVLDAGLRKKYLKIQMTTRTGWTRQQLLVAFNLYCQMPFGKMHFRNPEIVKFAELIGRTPSALAMKLTNIASLDPAITSTGRKGLEGASAADKAMWEEMQANWEQFAIESQQAVHNFGIANDFETIPDRNYPPDEIVDYTGNNKLVLTTTRVGQDFFRRAVLSAYDYRCCITGLAMPKLLVASHIVPWRTNEANCLNPRNGLCLSMLHDKAFDVGIITIAEDMTVIVSKKYATHADDFFNSALLAYEGKPIALPEKFHPDNEFLTYHRQHIFEAD